MNLGNTDVVTVEPGDVIRITAAGGGGWGPAHERDLQAVLTDVRGGFISIEGAARDYGVVMVDGVIDEEASAALRQDMAAHASNEFFGHSPGRIAHEKRWTRTLYEKFTDLLWQVPVNWRYYVKHQLMGTITGLDTQDINPLALQAAFDALLNKHPQLRSRVETSNA